MRVGCILLRLWLGLLLVLNGIGTATAASYMQRAHCTTSTGQAATHLQMACHANKVSAHDDRTMLSASVEAPDGCHGNACGCACLSGAQAVLPVAAARALGGVPVAITPRAAQRHASPPLPHLTRPPIG